MWTAADRNDRYLGEGPHGSENWEHVYGAKLPTEVSWYQREPMRSLDLLAETGVASESTIRDVGGYTR